MDLICVDPAVRRLAFAIYHRGVLVACGYCRSAEDIPLDVARSYHWVLEKPRKYDRFSVAHKDLDGLDRKLAGCRKVARKRGDSTEDTRPMEWKGNVPKHIHHGRLLRALGRGEASMLDGKPGAAMNYDHDVYDAVGIGLTKLDRVGRGGVRRKSRK
jgi:hypothetical protein